MPTIRFAGPGVDRMIHIDLVPGTRQTLLSVARAHAIPLLSNCETGECGACLVHVDTLTGSGHLRAPLTDKEMFLLTAMRLLAMPAGEDARRQGTPPGARLACQYEVGAEDIFVSFNTDLGSW